MKMHIMLTRYVFALTAILRILNLLFNIKDTKYEKYRQGPISPTSRATFPVVLVNITIIQQKPQTATSKKT